MTSAQVYELKKPVTAYRWSQDLCVVDMHIRANKWDAYDRYVRIVADKGDLLTIPAGSRLGVLDRKPDCHGVEVKILGTNKHYWVIEDMLRARSR